MKTLKIVKQNFQGHDVWEYTGSLVERHENKIVIEAYFDREDTPVDKLVLHRGDKFIETYFLDKWFNIYEIHDQSDGAVKAWYCNICFPPEIADNTLRYRDLELDLLVYPDGSQKVLDMEEFTALPLNTQVRSAALQALNKLQEMFSSKNENSSPSG